MRSLFAVLMLVFLSAAGPAPAELGTADQGAVQSTIRGQMDAFRRDDASGAFAFAAPRTQQLFGDANHFLDVVRRGYQPVYHPRGVDFTTLGLQDGAVVQSVELIGPDDAPYTALYTMERQDDGTWRIAACELLPRQRVGA